MTEEKADASSRTFNGCEVLFAGGTDWSFIGRNLGGSKKKGDTEVRITKAFYSVVDNLFDAMLSHDSVAIVGRYQTRRNISEPGHPCTTAEPLGRIHQTDELYNHYN